MSVHPSELGHSNLLSFETGKKFDPHAIAIETHSLLSTRFPNTPVPLSYIEDYAVRLMETSRCGEQYWGIFVERKAFEMHDELTGKDTTQPIQMPPDTDISLSKP